MAGSSSPGLRNTSGFIAAPAIHAKFTDARTGAETEAHVLPVYPPSAKTLSSGRDELPCFILDLPFKHPSIFYKRQISRILRKAANSTCVLQMGKRSPGEKPWWVPSHESLGHSAAPATHHPLDLIWAEAAGNTAPKLGHQGATPARCHHARVTATLTSSPPHLPFPP